MNCPSCSKPDVEINLKERRFDCSKCGFNRQYTHTEANLITKERNKEELKRMKSAFCEVTKPFNNHFDILP